MTRSPPYVDISATKHLLFYIRPLTLTDRETLSPPQRQKTPGEIQDQLNDLFTRSVSILHMAMMQQNKFTAFPITLKRDSILEALK